jgi:hypothetical protein
MLAGSGRPDLLSRILAAAWLALLAGLNIYRAATQSITIDEAWCWREFINKAPGALFTTYDACYHVLHTWLCWAAVSIFGLSEFTLRLPGLIAGFFYLAAVYRLARLLFTSEARAAVAVIVLSANPLILDHLSIARGYGMALAFFAWAFHDVLRWLIAPSEARRLARAGALLGFAIAANLTFTVPSAALAATVVTLEARRTRKWPWMVIERIAPPCIAIAFAIVIFPLSHAKASDFYFGAPDLASSLNTLVHPSLAHFSDLRPEWLKYIEWTVLPVVLLALLAGIAALLQHGAENAASFAAELSTGGLLMSLAALIAAHHIAGVLYPWGRTGIYLIWFLLAGCVAISASGARLFDIVCVALAAAFILQIESSYYGEFREDADMRAVMQRIGELDRGRPLAGSLELATVVDFYRARCGLQSVPALQPVSAAHSGAIYILLSKHRDIIERRHLRVLWVGPVSGVILAKSPSV